MENLYNIIHLYIIFNARRAGRYTCVALVWVTQKLRHYMLVFPVILASRIDSLKYLFKKHGLSNRMAKWFFMLLEFNITYVAHKSVKGKIIADFLASN